MRDIPGISSNCEFVETYIDIDLIFEKTAETNNHIYYDYKYKEQLKKAKKSGVIVIDKGTLERTRVELAEGDVAYLNLDTPGKAREKAYEVDGIVMDPSTKVWYADMIYDKIKFQYEHTGEFLEKGKVEQTKEVGLSITKKDVQNHKNTINLSIFYDEDNDI